MPLTDLDRQLLAEMLSGNSGSWKVFVDRFSGLIIQVIHQTAAAHSVKLSSDDLDDLCADTFSELVRRDMAVLRAFRGRCSLATYLTVVARRIVVRRMTQDRYRQAMGHVNAHQAALDTVSTRASELNRVDDRDELNHVFSALPSDLRRIASWFFIEGRSYREIAERLGKPSNSVGPILSRVRDLLKGVVAGKSHGQR
ncbi:MAG: RNA polymerase sigma factor [Planctomyces sp.]